MAISYNGAEYIFGPTKKSLLKPCTRNANYGFGVCFTETSVFNSVVKAHVLPLNFL